MNWLKKISWNWKSRKEPLLEPEMPKVRERSQMSLQEVAIALGVEIQQVPQLALDGGIRSFRTPRGTVYDRKSVLEFKRTKSPDSGPTNIEWKGMPG